ncbi:unnamed protein product [Dovyalis caffra]|uniref:non-specific serine/threonine protein kinase n=1 Tax=Dovyalis caffra TaxID=77055 RepID=A0AAV1QRF2_9ROSI|nr:unnamed protein product [Dovyalis caffra]
MNLHSHRLLLLPLLLFFTTTSTANIKPGSSLYASNRSQTWSSPTNTFFLGFTQLGPTSYTVSISYGTAGVPIWTTVSVVGGTASAAVVDSAGEFQFLRNGNLRLINGSDATVWTSNTANLGVTSASLHDSGTLVLTAGSINAWSSFENPTDTLVPSQNLTVNQTLRSGVYSFRLLSNGNISLTWEDSVVYWNQRLSALNLTSPSLQLQPNGILTLSDASMRRTENVAFANDYGEGGDIMRFLRLTSDGNLRMYSGGNTTMTWAALADQCQVYGYCGNMGICSYKESSFSPICKCPSLNFEAVDVNDSRKGCKRKVAVEDCVGNVTMLELKQTKFFNFQSQQIVSTGITACRGNCFLSASCIASTSLSDTNVWCYTKNTPDFVSGYQGPVLLSTSYVKVCGPVQPNPSPSEQSGGDKKCWKLWVRVVGAVVVASILGLAALVGLFWWFCCKKSPKFGGVWAQYTLLEYASGAPVQFSYKDLHRWTKGFKDKLGAGGFGAVYRGVLANRTVVAVKQLEGIEQVSAEINQKFSEWAYRQFEEGNLEAIVDRRLADQDVDIEQVMRAVQVSFWCIQEHPSQRPTMGKVVQMLEGIVKIARPPAPKAFTEGSISGTSANLSSKDSGHSTNEASAPPPSSSEASAPPPSSSSSSFQTASISPFISERIMEKPSSSLLESFQIKSH